MSHTSKKKILIIDPADFIGGAETYMLEFLQTAKKSRSFSFTVVTTGLREYLAAIPDNIKTYTVSLSRIIPTLSSLIRLQKSVAKVRDIVRKEKADLLVTNTVRAHVIGALVARKTKNPLIWNMHDFTFPKALLKFFAKYPRKIICVSYVVKKYVLDCTKGQYSEKIVVIPNGIDIEKVEQLAFVPTPLPLKKNEFWIGMIGRIEPWKGQKYFILAAKKILQIVPATRFFIIGSSVATNPQSKAYEQEMRKLVRQEKLSHKIFFMGFLSNVYPLLNQLDILVHASVEPEPFGRVILDGMALKKPVIASPLGGPLDIIEDAKDGYLIDPKDTERLCSRIIELFKHKEKRIMIGKMAYKKVHATFLQKTIVTRILHLFTEVL